MGDGRPLRLAFVLVLVLAAGGCATLGPRTSGADGPIEWKAVDLKLARENLGSPWVYSFMLQLQSTERQQVTFTEMEQYIYQPRTQPWSGRYRGQWIIPADGVLRLPLQSTLYCGHVEGNCAGTLMPIPLWRVTLTGSDDAGRNVRAVIDLRLPADPPGSGQ
jgi:hypothetical protein